MTGEPGASRATGQGWRLASLGMLAVAVLCFVALRDVRSAPDDGDWVTGAARFFAVLAAQGAICFLGVVFGLVEISRPADRRDRWNGAALWANVLFAFGVASWLALTTASR